MSVNDVSIELSSILQNLCNFDYGKNVTRKIQFTKIGCTIAPGCNDIDNITKMIRSGMNIARFNLSHGTQNECANNIQNLYKAIEENNRTADVPKQIAIAFDLNGPEIRTGMFPSHINEIYLNKNDIIQLTSVESYEKRCSKDLIYVNYPNLPFVVKPNTKIYLDDGHILLTVNEIVGDIVSCIVDNSAKLVSNTLVYLYGIPIELPLISDKDKNDIKFAVEQDIDILIVSNTRNSEHILKIRRLLGKKGGDIVVMAKINHMVPKTDLDEIIKVSDGIVLSRGFYGIEIPLEQSFLLQKAIIEKCKKNFKPIFCCGYFLHSMINKPYPTHAEISDISNAIFDGVDGIILLSETSRGKYPSYTILELLNISKEAEMTEFQTNNFENFTFRNIGAVDLFQAMILTAVDTAILCNASAIINITKTGNSAILLSQNKPKCVIFAVTRYPKVARKLLIYRSIYPVLYTDPAIDDDWHTEVNKRVESALITGRKLGIIKSNDPVVIINEWRRSTNFPDTLRIIYPCFDDEKIDNNILDKQEE